MESAICQLFLNSKSFVFIESSNIYGVSQM